MQTLNSPSSNQFLTTLVISIYNLNHYFGAGNLRRQVLFDINLDVKPGEIVIMTELSGSGKTTLLTLMGGLRSAQEGSLKILGQEICGASKQQLIQLRCQIGYIFQAHNLLTFLTAKQNVRMSLGLHDKLLQNLDTKAISMLEAVGLGDPCKLLSREPIRWTEATSGEPSQASPFGASPAP